MAENPLVSAEWLAERLEDPGVRVIEVSLDPDPAAYEAAHIPGARWVYWKDLLWHETDREFPDPETMARRLGALGVGSEDTLVLCGAPIQFATYAFWVLTMAGRDARLLDGGRKRWIEGGFPTTTDVPEPQRVEHAPGSADQSSRIGRDGVLAALDAGDRRILDFRTPEEYSGERVSGPTAPIDHGAERKGRIPTARHLFYQRLLNEDETFRPPADLRQAFADAGAAPDERIIAYCRLSHRASLGWFVATRLLDFPDVRVYDGSWTEWGSIVGVPVER
jgi:thiosulfate/3-mercaptopyruvate sulfurtransferase